MNPEERAELLKEDLRAFGDHIIAEYHRITWRTTWACAGIAGVMNIVLVIAVVAFVR